MSTIGGSTPPSMPPAQSPSRKKLSDSSSDQSKIYQKQRDATDTADRIQGQINDMQRDGESTMSNLKDEYERQYVAETSREEASLENQKLKGYEGIRDVQRQQQAELSRIRREGERNVNQLTDYYRNATYRARRDGEENLKQLESQHAQQTGFEQREGTTQLDQLRADNAREIANTQDQHNLRMARLQKESADQYEQKRLEADESAQRTSANLQNRYRQQISDQEHAVNRMNAESQQQINAIRADTSRKLSAYRDRQSDPFYQMMNLNANIVDAGDHYILTADIPSHEQKGVAVAVRGDQIVLQGTRRNEEKLELAPGHSQTSSSYQSYTESFPMMDPVDAKRLTKEFDGDTLIVRVPKKPPTYTPYKSKVEISRTRVARPAFPENLPHTGEEPLAPQISEGPSPKTKGSGTLT